MKNPVMQLTVLLFILLGLIACEENKESPTTIAEKYSSDMVLRWNEAGTRMVTQTGGIPPTVESRIYAMLALAMHDALNTISAQYDTYALTMESVPDADADAAVAQAAHDVIVALLPDEQHTADSLLSVSLAGITSGNRKEKGITVGSAAAKAMLLKQSTDGAATAQYPFTAGTLPAQYRPTPPFDKPPFNGFVSLPGWGKLHPFGLTTAAQFRPSAPYGINSLEYTKDYNEIRTMGCRNCPSRSTDQTQTGLFWLENVPLSWNRITRMLLVEQKLDGWKAARLLALLHMAEADANISSFEAKFHFNFWRPLTAIRLAEWDGNDNTTGEPTWDVLAPPTPPAPDYPSNHAVNGGAAAEILKLYFQTDHMAFTTGSSSLPGVNRSFSTFSQAAREVSLSRIYVGFHFRNAVINGEEQGRKIGAYIFEHCLKEK